MGMGGGERLGGGYFEIGADFGALDEAIAKIPGKLAAMGRAGATAGEQVKAGGMSGAMGLLTLSYALDDIRFGFSAIVNNLPGLGMALGGALGMGAEAGMKLGAVAGIAGVAINLLASNWDRLMGLFEGHYGVPEAVDSLEGMERALKGVDKEMEELRKKAPLTHDQLQRFYQLQYEEQAGKAAVGDIKAVQAAAAKPTAVQTSYARAADAVAAQVGGPENLRRQVREYIQANQGNMVGGIKLFRDADTGQFIRSLEEATNQYMAKLLKGDRGMFKWLGSVAFRGNATGKAFEDLDPDTLRRQRIARGQGEVEDRFYRAVGQGERGRARGQGDLEEQFNRAVRQGERGRARGQGNIEEQFERASRQARQNEEERLAEAMRATIGGAMLANPGRSTESFAFDAGKTMRAAGIPEEKIDIMAKNIVEHIARGLEHEVQARITGGLAPDRAAAQAQLAKENQERLKAERQRAGGGAQAEVMSQGEFFRRMMVAGLSRTEADKPEISPLPKDQIDALVRPMVAIKTGIDNLSTGRGVIFGKNRP